MSRHHSSPRDRGAVGEVPLDLDVLNRQRIFTRDGGRWGIGQVHRILTRATSIGRHEFNKRSESKELKPVSESVAGVMLLHLLHQGVAGRDWL